MFRKVAAIALAGVVLSSMPACNTVRGAGRDIESVADAANPNCPTKVVWRNGHRVRVCR
jgi:predicted small secreted protein